MTKKRNTKSLLVSDQRPKNCKDQLYYCAPCGRQVDKTRQLCLRCEKHLRAFSSKDAHRIDRGLTAAITEGRQDRRHRLVQSLTHSVKKSQAALKLKLDDANRAIKAIKMARDRY